MRRHIKLAVIASFAVVALSVAVFQGTPTTSAENIDLSSPRTLYVQNCARCHGSNGKGETALGRKLDSADLTGGRSVAGITRVVRGGKGKMPAFGKRLSAAQIAAVANYVHSL